MDKDTALRLALEALTVLLDEWTPARQAQLKGMEAITAIEAALEAKGEIDWKDMYEKQKRHTEMWVAKYEKDIGPLEKAVPQQEKKDEPCCYGGIAHDCHAGKGCKIAERLKTSAKAKDEPVAIDGNTSDGYHTFNELYEFRKAYNVALFNEWASNGKCSVHKSWRHNDGELCFGGGWFIVVAVLPQGQISNHYEAKDWGLFSVPETERALFEFDGHTGTDVVERLKLYTPPQRKPLTDEELRNHYQSNEWLDGVRFAEQFHGIKGEA